VLWRSILNFEIEVLLPLPRGLVQSLYSDRALRVGNRAVPSRPRSPFGSLSPYPAIPIIHEASDPHGRLLLLLLCPSMVAYRSTGQEGLVMADAGHTWDMVDRPPNRRCSQRVGCHVALSGAPREHRQRF
jgi:hypothetical protein